MSQSNRKNGCLRQIVFTGQSLANEHQYLELFNPQKDNPNKKEGLNKHTKINKCIIKLWICWH